jgi:hypothetical protein
MTTTRQRTLTETEVATLDGYWRAANRAITAGDTGDNVRDRAGSRRPGRAGQQPGLIVACVVGDGEAETGPLATSWHAHRFLNPARDGAVLPILMAAVLDEAIGKIRSIQSSAYCRWRARGGRIRCHWPRSGPTRAPAAARGVDAVLPAGRTVRHRRRAAARPGPARLPHRRPGRDRVEPAAAGLGFLGVTIDLARNAAATADADISAASARVRTLVITAREDVEIARQTRAALARPAARVST